MNGQVSMHVCVCVCVGSTGGLVVVRWVPSLFKARVDKTTDCGDHNILTSGGPGGTSGVYTTNNWCSQCSCEYPARLQEIVLCWP